MRSGNGFAPMRVGTILVLLVLSVAAVARAEGERLTGTQFVSVMDSNTLSGTTDAGVPFNAYFLTGGRVTYEEQSGERDNGTWRMDDDGDVCITWQRINEGREECFHVTLDGRKLSWKGKTGQGTGLLRGAIAETFLTDR